MDLISKIREYNFLDVIKNLINLSKQKIKKYFPTFINFARYIKVNFQKKTLGFRKENDKERIKKALNWLKDNIVENGGIVVSSRQKISYPEVTGYCIPTLYDWGEKELAKELVSWLISQQNKDGSFSAPDGMPYTFDTGQVIRGFMSALGDFPEAEKPLRKACDWILDQIKPNGQLTTPSKKDWGDIADERIHLYVLPPLIEAGKKLKEQKYINSAKRVLEYYKTHSDLIEFNTLTHFYGYVIEALYDLGESQLAKKAMDKIAKFQKKDGSIPAYKNVSWVCAPGLAQLAIIFYKLGMHENGHKAINYLKKIQNKSGGFYGSYKFGADYFPLEEVSWAVKFFLDAYYWKIKTTFDEKIDIFLETIDEKDERVQELIFSLGDLSNKKVIDVGCGKGRFLRVLRSKFPKAQLYGYDISENMLKYCPEDVIIKSGSILDIKYSNNSFDCIYCIETLEHAICIENAIKEMIRILKPGGMIVIIDKNTSELGALKIEPWEQWFKPGWIKEILNKYKVQSQYKNIVPDKDLGEKLFILWKGRKYE